VYIFTLVGDVEKVLEKLRLQHGDFALAMLFNSALNVESSWNLIVAAQWMDRMRRIDATRLVAQALHQDLGLENKVAISRVTVLQTDDPFVREMTKLYPVTTPSPIQNFAAGELEGSGFVFYSQAAA
jgi:hypothetical protein